jgi:hypothetical protein
MTASSALVQVEHPVTEMISGVNLPAAQVQVSTDFAVQTGCIMTAICLLCWLLNTCSYMKSSCYNRSHPDVASDLPKSPEDVTVEVLKCLPLAQIGMGIPLYRIPDIRRLFGSDSDGSSRIDFERDLPVAPLGMCEKSAMHSKHAFVMILVLSMPDICTPIRCYFAGVLPPSVVLASWSIGMM